MTMSDGTLKNKELQQEIIQWQNRVHLLHEENEYLKSELRKCNIEVCVSEVMDDTDYKTECKKLREQLDNSIKTIKYLSGLL